MTAKKAFWFVAVGNTAYLLGLRYLVHQVTAGEVSETTLYNFAWLGGGFVAIILGIFVHALIKMPSVRR